MHHDAAECKRALKRRRIVTAARRLVVERGYEGFTMHDLAEAVGVSRRTLFNLVTDKASAVLGDEGLTPGVDDEAFMAGTGGVADDLFRLIRSGLELADDDDVRETRALFEAALRADPKVVLMVLARQQRSEAALAELVRRREGWAEDDNRAAVAALVVTMVLQLTIARVVATAGATPASDVFDDVVRALRDVMEPRP